VLAPAGQRGWFAGRALVADEAVEVRSGISLAEASAALEAVYDGADDASLAAVLAAYDGTCSLVRFSRVEPLTEALFPASVPMPERSARLLLDAVWDLPPRAFRSRVRETRERIAAGDVYVLNLTARLEGRLAVDSPEAAFSALCERAGADMAAFLGGWPGATPWLASVSPERFVRVTRDGRADGAACVVEVCPIKGTTGRAAAIDADRAAAAALAADPKERAEHVMIVDLERNDIGVCCVPGSVFVEPLQEVVATPYCHQMVSSVRGTLRPDATFAELFGATFPCGSVTGAPKVAAMRIIGELEATPRGAYCGALLVAVPGELDSSVLIRSLEGVAEKPGVARWGAGCGITTESDPAAEYLEMLLKASPVTGDGLPGEALRETMRVSRGRVPLLERHLARLAAGGAGPSALARVRAAVAEQLAQPLASGAYARLGITLTPDGEVAAGLTDAPSSLAVEGGPVLLPVEIAELPALPAHAAKPASRRFWDRAHHAAEVRGAHQALLHTPDGTLVDGSTATVWLVTGAGELVTPPAPPAIAGVCRELVFDTADELGVPATERALTLTDYEAAAEVWLSNAVGGFVGVRGRTGSVGGRIAEQVAAVMAGE
jgi:para-aminobenzoate synthetase/4-amino-4-deoxychorismate lyase